MIPSFIACCFKPSALPINDQDPAHRAASVDKRQLFLVAPDDHYNLNNTVQISDSPNKHSCGINAATTTSCHSLSTFYPEGTGKSVLCEHRGNSVERQVFAFALGGASLSNTEHSESVQHIDEYYKGARDGQSTYSYKYRKARSLLDAPVSAFGKWPEDSRASHSSAVSCQQPKCPRSLRQLLDISTTCKSSDVVFLEDLLVEPFIEEHPASHPHRTATLLLDVKVRHCRTYNRTHFPDMEMTLRLNSPQLKRCILNAANDGLYANMLVAACYFNTLHRLAGAAGRVFSSQPVFAGRGWK